MFAKLSEYVQNTPQILLFSDQSDCQFKSLQTGSFLTANIWRDVRRLVKPPLNVYVESYHEMDAQKWQSLHADVDVVIPFHASAINESIAQVCEWETLLMAFSV